MAIEAIWNHNYGDDCIPNFKDNMILPRHRWYDFKEGYGNSLVERAISETKKNIKRNTLVVDPFSGSGTTPLSALQNGCDTISMEVNPFMSFVGETKCKSGNKKKKEYLDLLHWIMDQKPIEIESDLEEYSSFSHSDGNEKWLFNRSVLRGFEALRMHILKLEDSDFFMLGLFSSVMEYCNAKKDGKCLRYKKKWDTLAYSSIELRESFYNNSCIIIDDLESMPLDNVNKVFHKGDARDSFKKVEGNIADLIVFSPPYLNSFDYSDVYRPELFLGRFVESNDELRKIRAKTLRSHVQYKWENNDIPNSVWANEISKKVNERSDYLWNKDIPKMINCYFFDMEKIIEESYRVARKGASLWFVISTSAYAGIEIPVDLILADIAVRKGWELIGVNALRKLRTSSQCSSEEIRKIRLRESLIMCRK